MKDRDEKGRFIEGHKCTPEMKKRMTLAKKGKHYPKMGDAQRGRKMSQETRKKISLTLGGTGISKVTSKRYYHTTGTIPYRQWRMKVFLRDSFTCQSCGNRGVYVEAHHIKSWAKYKELRYEVKNGVTLCKECHRVANRLTRKNH